MSYVKNVRTAPDSLEALSLKQQELGSFIISNITGISFKFYNDPIASIGDLLKYFASPTLKSLFKMPSLIEIGLMFIS